MDENTGGTAAPVDTSPPLTSLLGEMFGDYRDAEPESDAGAPPAATPEPTADRSEGSAASAPAGAPPAVADASSVPDAETPAPAPDLDPLEGSTPLAYTVNGESRSFEGITVLKDGGAIVDPDALEKVQRVFGERDHLFEQNKAQYAKYADLERLTTWQTKDANGNVKDLVGAPALYEQRSLTARAMATMSVLDAALRDPAQATALVDFKQDAEGNVFVVWNEAALDNLRTRAKLASMQADQTVRAHLGALAAPPTPVELPASDHAMPTINQIVAENSIAGLTEADKQWAAGHFEHYVVATKEGRVVKPQFVELLKDRAALRTEQPKIAAAASTATAANAARIAAASVGRPAAKQTKITPPKTPEPSRDDDFDALWEKNEKAAAGALKAHATAR